MHYLFSGFKLDTEKKALYYQTELVSLTKQNYQLLFFFVTNSGCILDKNQLIENVWDGRIVADNSIDQSIYKLKKILTSKNNINYFETVYGLGTKFLPTVETISKYQNNEKENDKTFFVKLLFGLGLACLLVFMYWKNQTEEHLPANTKPLFVIVPNADITSKDNWLQNSPNIYIEKLLSLSNSVTLKHYADKPNNLDQQQYLEAQWKLSPDLLVVTSKVSIQDSIFTVQLSIANKQGEIDQKQFQNNKLNTAFAQSIEWLNERTLVDRFMPSVTDLIPQKPYLLELYMRGLSATSNHKIDEAINYFELCLEENPDYHLAALELAKLRERQGEINKALALLDSITLINDNPSIEIETANIQGGILLRQGKPEQAKVIYTDILSKYQIKQYKNLLVTKHKLSILYATLSQNHKALKEFSAIELVLKESQDYEFLADIYQAKSSLLLRTGETKQASIYMAKAMQLFVEVGDLIGQAKTHSVASRIAIQQADYAKASVHLKQALNITKSLNHQFGIGATLNEIITVLIAQGKINEAWVLNQELESIAIEIDFTAMLLAAKRYTIIISELKKQWKTADIYLKEHLEIANAANNKRAIIENRFLTISLGLKQNKLSGIKQLIADLQTYIKESEEQRLMPQLNILKAGFYYQSNETDKAETLLVSSKVLAQATEDGQSIISINNLLAEYYLKDNNPQKALFVLEESTPYHPVAQPYLLLKSKANKQLNQLTKAIELATMCKLEANDLWSNDDAKYLAALVSLKNLK